MEPVDAKTASTGLLLNTYCCMIADTVIWFNILCGGPNRLPHITADGASLLLQLQLALTLIVTEQQQERAVMPKF